MYSLILVAALTPGADVTPAPAAPSVVVGCHGCIGVPVSNGCVGCLGCAGCYGCYGCAGCYGGPLFRHHRLCFLGFCKRSCLGCVGYSCTGYNCFGTCLGCTGCLGVVTSHGTAVMPAYTSPGVYGTVTSPSQPPTPPAAAPSPTPKPMPEPKSAEPMKTGANIRFKLPAAARLFVDGRPTLATGTERAFSTPPLVAGQKFYYDVRAEVEVNGVVVVEEKRVIVEAGANLVETFPKLIAAIEQSETSVAGK